MINAPFELVWMLWRKTYRSKWGSGPVAKKPTSMRMESSTTDDDGTESVKVCVQFGPKSYETSFVKVSDAALDDWHERQRVLSKPKSYWVSQESKDRKRMVGFWEVFEKWVATCDKTPGEYEVALRLLEVFQRMKSSVDGLERPVMVCWHLALSHSNYHKKSTPASDAVLCCLIGMLGALDLHRECHSHTRASAGDGYDGSPRTLWEDRNGLTSALARKEFAKGRMIHYGFLNGD